MKRMIPLLFITTVLLYCKTKKNTADTLSSSQGSGVNKITVLASGNERELILAQKRWAGTTAGELLEGKSIFYGKCTRCHPAKKISGRTEERWIGIIEDMAVRVKLSEYEKLKLTKYILSYMEAHEN